MRFRSLHHCSAVRITESPIRYDRVVGVVLQLINSVVGRAGRGDGVAGTLQNGAFQGDYVGFVVNTKNTGHADGLLEPRRHLYDAKFGALDNLPKKTAAAGLAPYFGGARRACQIQPWLDLLADGLRLREQQQVIRTARLGIGSGHVETAERVRSDHSSGALAVQVQVPYVELVSRPLQLLWRRGVKSTGEAVNRVVRDGERVIEIAGFDHREHRPEDFFLRNARVRSNIRDDCGLQEVSIACLLLR